MKQQTAMVIDLLAVALVWGACGGGGGGSNPPTPVPSPPVVPQQQPPDFDVSGPWSGSSSDSLGSGAIDLFLRQDGGVVLGTGSITEDKQRNALFAGTLSASTLSFNLNYGGNCVRQVSGALAVSANSMSGTFSGSSCTGAIQNGQVSLTSGRLDLAGAWSGDAPSVLGPGSWTWQLQQSGNRITGTVTIATSNLQETDALQGVFFYPSQNPGFSFSFSLSSAPCAGVSVAVTPLRDTLPLTATQISGLATVAQPCLGGTFADFVLAKR